MKIIDPKWTQKQKINNWMNLLAHVHDNNCNCDEPLQHTIHIILEKEPNIQFQESTKQLLKKCLGTEDSKEDGDDVDGLGIGDLERLFAEDTGEDTG